MVFTMEKINHARAGEEKPQKDCFTISARL
jgi:hypothetical protein